MSGSISRKRRRKSMRQQNKEEIRLYTKSFVEDIESELFIHSGYTTLTSEQVRRLVQGVGVQRR
ncbi:hypothetical protein E4H12_11770 [Candidatus Thorarchaeota archaeon]|nr:MAG: hypothetical protein E4H12_11770 [Candidatus Thorarchaeota archaeon]